MWHLPVLHRVVATNYMLRVACTAKSSALWEVRALFMKIPRLDANCILLMPSLFAYSDEICVIYRGICQILMNQVILELFVTYWKALAPQSADVQRKEGFWVNSCFVPCQTGTPTALWLFGNLFLSHIVKGRVNKAAGPATLWDCPYPVTAHQEFETSPCLVQGV